MKHMKKLIMLLLATGLLALLSLSTVAYADSRDDHGGKDGDHKDHDVVPLCIPKDWDDEKDDHKFELAFVKIWDVKDHIDDGAFFPKIKVLEEEKDHAVVKLSCEKDDKDDHKKDDHKDDKDDHKNDD
jgi:hypothetical protein